MDDYHCLVSASTYQPLLIHVNVTQLYLIFFFRIGFKQFVKDVIQIWCKHILVAFYFFLFSMTLDDTIA